MVLVLKIVTKCDTIWLVKKTQTPQLPHLQNSKTLLKTSRPLEFAFFHKKSKPLGRWHTTPILNNPAGSTKDLK